MLVHFPDGKFVNTSNERGIVWVQRQLLWNLRPGGSRPFWVRNRLVGLSCLLYFLPSMAYLTLSYRINCYIHSPFAGFLCLIFASVAVVSFLADYMHIPVMTVDQIADWFENPNMRNRKYPPSVWGRRDRIISMTAAILAAIECGLRLGFLASFLSLGICLALINYSRNSSSSRCWVIRHSLWHVLSSLVLFIVAYY